MPQVPPPAPDLFLGQADADPVSRWSRRGVLFTVLGVMTAMALLSLTFALATVSARRKNDPKPLPTVTAPLPVLPPVEWAALSYLPDHVDFVLGINVAAAEQSDLGKAFLARTNLGNLGFTVHDLENTTGLKLADMDHVILGVRVEDLRTVLVVRTRRPYDAARVRTALKASVRGEGGNRDVYHFTLAKPHLSAVLWSPDENTLVLGLSAKDIAAISSPPAAGRLPGALAELLRQNTTAGDVLWMAGRFDKAAALRELLASHLTDEERTALAATQEFVFGLELGSKVNWAVTVNCTDADGASAVVKALEKLRANNGVHLKVIGPGPAGEKVAHELAESLRVERVGSTVRARAHAGAPDLPHEEKK